jgi:MFS family permease
MSAFATHGLQVASLTASCGLIRHENLADHVLLIGTARAEESAMDLNQRKVTADIMKSSEHFSGFRWVILAQIVVVTMCSTTIAISFAPLIGVIAKDLGIGMGSASFGFMGLHMLATAVGCAISGYLIDRFGVLSVVNGSMALMVVSNALLPLLGHAYWAVVAIRVVEAFGCAPVFVAIGPAVALWFPPREAGTALGVQSMAISAGIMLGLVASPHLAQAASSWQNGVAELSVGLAVALCFVLVVSYMAKKHAPAAHAALASDSPDAFSRLWSTRPFLAGLFGICCGVWTQQAFNSLAPGYLAVMPPMGLGLGAVTSGNLMTVVLFAGIVASLVGGILVDKVCGGHARPVITAGFALIAICPVLMVVSSVCSQRFALVLCLVLIGTGTPFINPVILGFAAKTFPASVVGRVVGSWMSAAVFSGAAGVMVGSAALSSTGNYRLPMEVTSAVAVLGLLIALFITPGKFSQAVQSGTHDELLADETASHSRLGGQETL